jgi:ribosomal protein L35
MQTKIKIKTHKGMLKRIRITRFGKFKLRRPGFNHHCRRKSQSSTQHRYMFASPADEQHVRRLLKI